MSDTTRQRARQDPNRYGVKPGTPEYQRAWRAAHRVHVTWRQRAQALKDRRRRQELSAALAENARLKAQLESQSSPLGALVDQLEPVKPLTPPEK